MCVIDNEFECGSFNIEKFREKCFPLIESELITYSLDEIENKKISVNFNKSLAFNFKLDLVNQNRLDKLMFPLGKPIYINKRAVDNMINNAFRVTNYYKTQIRY